MKRWIVWMLWALAGLQAGCSSVPVQRAKDLSSAGIAYSRATAAVIDLAMDAAVDASSERLVRRGLGPATTPEQRAEREASLTERDNELVLNLQLYVRLKRSVGAVEAYFAGLQALAGDSPGEATEAALKTLVDRVNGLNTALESGRTIDDEKKGAIAGFGKLLVQQAHGAAVARAMERDAAVIGRALVLQELTLQAAAGDVRASLKDANARFYRDRVMGPYLAGGVGTPWADDRRLAVRTRALGTSVEAVASAQDAARQMQAVWGRILSGQSTGQEFLASIRDVQELLDAVIALKKAD